jgi:hypothetical protein
MSLVKRRWRVVVECLVVAALVVTAFLYGRFAFLNRVAPIDYYWMSPAVMVTVGQGFREPLPEKGSALDDFLASRRPSLDLRDAIPPKSAPPSQFDYETMYLLSILGYWWRITGIRWSALADVTAALHALSVIGMYATLRLFTPLLVSIAGALWMCTSSIQLSLVPNVRDYSKGGFILAVIPLILVATLRARSRTAVIALSAAAGALIGLGLGFRMDLAIMVPIAFACIFLFRDHRPWTALVEKALAVGALTAALLVTAYPVLLKVIGGGSNSFHVILLGYADQFDDSLGITRSVYRVLPYYDDGYVEQVVNARSERTTGHWPSFGSAEYDRFGRQLWTDLLRQFPADSFVRVLGATNAVLNLVFANPSTDLVFKRAPPAGGLLNAVYAWFHGWDGWGAALGLMFVVVASLSSLRLGLLTMFLLFALGGYPSLQFGLRHYFHLQAVPVFAGLVLIWSAVMAPFQVRRGQLRPMLVNLVTAVATLLLAITVPLAALRAYQSRHVDRMLLRFLDSPRTTLDVESVQTPDRKRLVRWAQVAGQPSKLGPVARAYYLVEFDAQGSPDPAAIGLRYRLSPTQTSCLHVLSAADAGLVRFGFEVFSYAGHEFEGIEIEDRAKDRLRGIYRMNEDGPGGLPLELRMPSDWRSRPLYQRLQLEGHDDRGVELKAGIPFRSCE